jgi:hypothetical protein
LIQGKGPFTDRAEEHHKPNPQASINKSIDVKAKDVETDEYRTGKKNAKVIDYSEPCKDHSHWDPASGNASHSDETSGHLNKTSNEGIKVNTTLKGLPDELKGINTTAAPEPVKKASTLPPELMGGLKVDSTPAVKPVETTVKPFETKVASSKTVAPVPTSTAPATTW